MLGTICMLMAGYLLAGLSNVNGSEPKVRYRRSWLMPGTLWCGVGSTAENYTNLGLFRGLDICCREHDHCTPQIQSFELLYGFRNYRLHTVSHCDCDQRFRLCLHALNDTMSTLVGTIYFNFFEPPCFTLIDEEQCTEWHWWGGCKKRGLVPKAEIWKQDPFNYTQPTGKYNAIPITHKKTQTTVRSPQRRNFSLSHQHEKRKTAIPITSSKVISTKPPSLPIKSKNTTTPCSNHIVSANKGRRRRLLKKLRKGCEGQENTIKSHQDLKALDSVKEDFAKEMQKN